MPDICSASRLRQLRFDWCRIENPWARETRQSDRLQAEGERASLDHEGNAVFNSGCAESLRFSMMRAISAITIWRFEPTLRMRRPGAPSPANSACACPASPSTFIFAS